MDEKKKINPVFLISIFVQHKIHFFNNHPQFNNIKFQINYLEQNKLSPITVN